MDQVIVVIDMSNRMMTTVKVGYVIASNEVMLSGKPIGYFYREEPENEGDSGWRFFSGEETQEYADDSNNFSMYNASSIVCLLYTSPSPRDATLSRMPSSA